MLKLIKDFKLEMVQICYIEVRILSLWWEIIKKQ